jgi:hypothetical protein
MNWSGAAKDDAAGIEEGALHLGERNTVFGATDPILVRIPLQIGLRRHSMALLPYLYMA